VRNLIPTIQSQLPSSVLLVPAYDRFRDHVGKHKRGQTDASYRLRVGG